MPAAVYPERLPCSSRKAGMTMGRQPNIDPQVRGRWKKLVKPPGALQKSVMEKIPCNECGALILPATAESTGGICMACKQGIRKSMDASRDYYESLKSYDPFRELWKSLVERSSLDRSLVNFSVKEQRYFAVSLLDGEVYNGGFDQFFSNSSGNYR
jgi:hypothetical protein